MSQTPMTHTMNISDARAQLTSVVKQVFLGEHRVLIQKSGIPVAVIVSAQDAERLAEYERQRQEDFTYLDSMREKFSHIPIEEHEREVARAVQEARQELRQERAAEVSTPGVT